jgi:hypothetical protein
VTPTPDQSRSDPKPAWQQQLDYVSGFIPKLAAVGGLAYICGLIVVQVHLQRFGVNSLGFFAPQYIAAGMWALGFFGGLAGFAFYFAFGGLKRPAGITLWGEIALILAASVTTPSLIVGFLVLSLGTPFRIGWLLLGAPFFLVSFLLALGVSNRLGQPRISGQPWLDILLDFVILLIVALVLFGKFIYPSIPARWGGGQPVSVQIVVTADGASRLFKATILADTSQAVWGRLLLLTEKDVLILPAGHERPVLLQRALVPALVLEPIDTARIEHVPLEAPEPGSK